MTNKLKIDWDKLKTFTLIPLEVSSICKYNGKKLSADHKNIYSYFHKLQYDEKLNDTGYASFDSLMKRFGIGSKGSLTGFINHLVDVGLLIRHKEGNGTRNRYEVKDIDLSLATYPSKSHVADSNKNKKHNNPQDKKANNYPLAKKYREILKGDKLKAFNQWIWKADQEGIQLTAQDYATWSKHYDDTEERKPHFEKMEHCDDTENYAALVPPSKDFDLTPAPDNYNDSLQANYGFMDDINLDGCPSFSESEQELASYEQHLFIDEDTAEREEDITNLFTNSCDEKPEPIENSTPKTLTPPSAFDTVLFFKSQMSHMKEDFDRSMESYLEDDTNEDSIEGVVGDETDEPKGDKSKLVCLISNVDISDIDVESKGIGYFAAPLARDDLNIMDTQQYLKVLHTHFWDDYLPDQATVESIFKKLTCNCCGDKVDQYGYCINRECTENENFLPF